mgnify:CR=1 FL=1
MLGAVLMVAGFGLLAWAYVAARRQRVTIHLAEDGYRIVEPTGERTGTWSQVSRLTGAPGLLTLHPGDPRTLRAIGDAAVGGIGYQGASPSPRQVV